MGYLDRFKWQPLITNPVGTYSYRKVLKEERNKSEKELREEMKAKLSPEEYTKWWQQHYYAKNKEKIARQYKERRELELAEIMETYHELYDDEPTIPTPRDLEDKYVEEVAPYYKTIKKDRWQFNWWNSRINKIRFKCFPYEKPIRLCHTWKLNVSVMSLLNKQNDAYKYLYPFIDKIDLNDINIGQHRYLSWMIRYITRNFANEVIEWWEWMSKVTLCQVATAVKRWVFIRGAAYLWRYSYLVWGMICTEKWHLFIPQLWQFSWVNKDNYLDVAKNVKLWLNWKSDICPRTLLLEDCYLIQVDWASIQNKKWDFENNKQYEYYIVPFKSMMK